MLRELAHLNSSHDVFLILIDAAFAFEVPKISAGWVEAFDVETGRSRVMSRGALRQMAATGARRGRTTSSARRRTPASMS